MVEKKRIFAHSCHPRLGLFDEFARSAVCDYMLLHPGKGVSKTIQYQWETASVWLISALYDAHLAGVRGVILPRGKATFQGQRYGYQITLKVVSILVALRWIRLDIAPSGRGLNRASELIASKRLLRVFNRVGRVWTERTYNDCAEVVILREKDSFLNEKFTLPTPETAEVRSMRSQIHEINRWTLRHAVFPFLPDSVLTGLMRGRDNMFVNFNNITYRRIFALGRLDKGGRFYGGWWQQIPTEFRSHIRIDDEPTVELDFGATIVTLLYGYRGLMVPDEPYDLGINPDRDSRKRSAIKTYIAALLNATGSYQLPKEERVFLGVTSAKLRQLVEQKHHQIADAFGSGIGLDLMYLDSQIALLVKKTLLNERVPVLGIHDGFITQLRHERLLHDTMMESFKQVSGIYPVIKPATKLNRFRSGSYCVYSSFISGWSLGRTPTVPSLALSHKQGVENACVD
jgi:hypothetical protein